MFPELEFASRKFVVVQQKYSDYENRNPPELLYYIGDKKWTTNSKEACLFDTRQEANAIIDELAEGMVFHVPLTWKELAEYASKQEPNSGVILWNDNDVMVPFIANGNLECLRDDDYSDLGSD